MPWIFLIFALMSTNVAEFQENVMKIFVLFFFSSEEIHVAGRLLAIHIERIHLRNQT